MSRIARIVVPDLSHHVTQRGSRRQQTFFAKKIMKSIIRLMAGILHALRDGGLGVLPDAEPRSPRDSPASWDCDVR